MRHSHHEPPSEAAVWPIRVWVGYGLGRLIASGDRCPFYRVLGDTFIPATVQSMTPWGLTAYLAAVLDGDPDPRVPDEVALVAYRDVDAYHAACTRSVAGRAYVRLHGTAFRFDGTAEKPGSHSGFPRSLPDQPGDAPPRGYWHAFDGMTDWREPGCQVEVAVAGARDGTAFRDALMRRLADFRAAPPAGMNGLIVAVDDGLAVVWSHWRDAPRPSGLLATLPAHRLAASLTDKAVAVPAEPCAEFPGVPIRGGQCVNVRPDTNTSARTRKVTTKVASNASAETTSTP